MEDQPPTFEQRYHDLARAAEAAPKSLPIPRSPNFSRADVVAAITSVFEMIGGVPRFAVWANENEGEYYKIYAKFMPSQQQVNVVVSNGEAPRAMERHELEAAAAKIVAEQLATYEGSFSREDAIGESHRLFTREEGDRDAA